MSNRVKALSKDQEQACERLIDKIVELADLASHEGLLAMEDKIVAVVPLDFVLIHAVQLLIDGTFEETVEKTLRSMLWVGEYEDWELLYFEIILTGVLYLRSGYTPRNIKELLSAYLGVEYYMTRNQDSVNRQIGTEIETNGF